MRLEEMTPAQIEKRMEAVNARLDRYSTGDDLLDLFDPAPGLRRLTALYGRLRDEFECKSLLELLDDHFCP